MTETRSERIERLGAEYGAAIEVADQARRAFYVAIDAQHAAGRAWSEAKAEPDEADTEAENGRDA
jgi:hypothetical protein